MRRVEAVSTPAFSPTIQNAKPIYRPTKLNPDYKGKWSAPMIDNPEYKGVWAPRKIPNPEFFEDLSPLKSLDKIGGLGIELWTMTEDIVFDNIYVGHSAEDAKALAAATYHLKKAKETAESAAAKEAEEDEESEAPTTFPANIVHLIREKVTAFVDVARYDPVFAVKAMPEVAGGLAVVVLTILGMFGSVLGLMGSKAAPKAKVFVPLALDVQDTDNSDCRPSGRRLRLLLRRRRKRPLGLRPQSRRTPPRRKSALLRPSKREQIM